MAEQEEQSPQIPQMPSQALHHTEDRPPAPEPPQRPLEAERDRLDWLENLKPSVPRQRLDLIVFVLFIVCATLAIGAGVIFLLVHRAGR